MMLLKGSLRQSKRYYLKYLKYLAYLLLVPVFFFGSKSLEIKTIVCRSAYQECDPQHISYLNQKKGQSFLAIKQKNLYENLNKIKPIKKIELHFLLFNTLKIELEEDPTSIPVNFLLLSEFPTLSFEESYSSESASVFQKPSVEIKNFLNNTSVTTFNLWLNGEITPTATQSTKIIVLSKSKPETNILKNLYSLVNLLNKYIEIENIYLVGRLVIIRSGIEPDIITSVLFDDQNLSEALQSLGFLTTMKKDVKVVDLRYKNPIIR